MIILLVLKRIIGMISFIVSAIVLSIFAFIIIFPVYGLDKADTFVNKYCMPVFDWCK